MRFASFFILLLAACSSGPSVDDACNQVAAATCAKIDACIQGGVLLRYTDESTCLARQKAGCVTSLGAPDTASTPSGVIKCATAIPTTACDDYENVDFTACTPPAGPRANGSPCTYPAQCQSAVCAIVKGTNCGTCSSVTTSGDSCATASCSRGFNCVASTDACQQPVGAGGSCDKDHPCGYQLTCVLAMAATSGTCTASGTTAGAACDPRKQTGPGCDPDSALSCGIASKQCVAATYTGAGNACGLVGAEVVSCNAASICYGAMGTTAGTCKAISVEGEPCDTSIGPGCMAPARCVTGGGGITSGTCQLPDPKACG